MNPEIQEVLGWLVLAVLALAWCYYEVEIRPRRK